MKIRPLTETDLPAVQAVYAHAAESTTATMDYRGKTREELTAWLAGHGGRYPALAAEIDGELAGYASLSPFASRPGYLASAELSIYVAPQAQGKGVGGELCRHATEHAREDGLSTVLALITAGNDASIRMVASCGYHYEGAMRQIAYKHGDLIDLLIYQRVFAENCGTRFKVPSELEIPS